MDLRERCAAVRRTLEGGDARAAFRELRPAFRDHAAFQDEAAFAEAAETLGAVGGTLAGAPFRSAIDAVAQAPSDAQLLFDAGYVLVEAGLPDIAAAVLSRANALYPHEEPIVTELAAALHRDGRDAEAAALLCGEDDIVGASYELTYLLALSSVLSGDTDVARALTQRLAVPPSDDAALLRDRIGTMLARAEAVRGVTGLGAEDLRGWHFTTTGGVLLHLSPYGVEEMAGRYGFLQDEHARCKEGLLRLKAVLDLWGSPAKRVVALPEKGSTVLAHAAATVLGLPLAAWDANARGGLVVAYDLDDLGPEALDALAQKATGEILFAQSANWTAPPAFAPDVVTYLAQTNIPPWEPHLRVPKDAEPEKSPPDTRAPVEIAADIASADVSAEALADLPQLLALASAAPGLTAAAQPAGPRSPFWAGSPVHSNRFD